MVPTSYKLRNCLPWRLWYARTGGAGAAGGAPRARILEPAGVSQLDTPNRIQIPHSTAPTCNNTAVRIESRDLDDPHGASMLYLVWRRVCDGPRVVRTPCESRSAVLTAEPEGPLSRCGRAVAVRGPAHALRGPEARTRTRLARGADIEAESARRRVAATHVCSKLFDIELLVHEVER